jgi:aldose 1-epimerase
VISNPRLGILVETISIAEDGAAAEINTLGAHVASVSLGGRPLIKPGSDWTQTRGGIAVLIPYAGRVRDGRYQFEGRSYQLPIERDGHAIHGFAKDARWRILRKRVNSVILESRLKDKGYPGVLEARIRYSIGRVDFSTECSVRNVSRGDCPLVIGFHPYFLADDWKISVGGTSYRYELGDGYFPTGKRAQFTFRQVSQKMELDDCFRVGGTIRLLTGEREVVIRRRGMPYLVVYNGEYAEGRSVAIEPYTGLDDAYNNGIGLRILGPGEMFRCGYGFALGDVITKTQTAWDRARKHFGKGSIS